VAVFTGDYKLLLNTTDHWLCSYTEYKEGNRHYVAYGNLNLNEWFSEKEVAELENYLYQYTNPSRVKKAGDFLGYTLELEGLWVDDGMIIPDKITVVAAYAKSIDKDDKGNITTIAHHRESIAVYTPSYENTRDLPYFQDGFIQPRINGNYSRKKQDELRRMVTNEENLKETIISIIPSPFYSIKSVGILTYRYYLLMPYQNSIRSIGDQNYYSDFWTVIGRDVNMWDRCSTTLIFVWISWIRNINFSVI
jgi:hypothetical protein